MAASPHPEGRRTGRRRRAVGRAVRGRGRTGCGIRILVVLLLVGLAGMILRDDSREEVNPYTGEAQRLLLTARQEAALGLRSVETMAAQHGGWSRDERARRQVETVGRKLAEHTDKLVRPGGVAVAHPFGFHLLADEESVNAFALPGGQIFLTTGLFRQLKGEAQLAGVLGHEVGHVIARHAAEQMTEDGSLEEVGAAPGSRAGGDDRFTDGQVSGFVSAVLSLRHRRGDELEADEIGARLMYHAGYDPRELLGVMEILRRAGGAAPVEMLGTHPLPDSRVERLRNEVLPGLGIAPE